MVCEYKGRKMLKSSKEIKNLRCPECKECVTREVTGPSSQVMEVLDNGAMPRRLERLRDAEDLYRSRSKAADPNAGK